MSFLIVYDFTWFLCAENRIFSWVCDGVLDIVLAHLKRQGLQGNSIFLNHPAQMHKKVYWIKFVALDNIPLTSLLTGKSLALYRSPNS